MLCPLEGAPWNRLELEPEKDEDGPPYNKL
jgi:hypothetical protein